MHSAEKKQFRERILTLLRNQQEEKRLEKSLDIADKLFQLQEYRLAKTILFYASFDGEVDTISMIEKTQQAGKRVGLPKIDKSKKIIHPMLLMCSLQECELGPYGIMEPPLQYTKELSFDDIDMVVVPGVAFDKNGLRMGRGGGYYDRFLSQLPAATPKVGLAFDFQIFDSLPAIAPHDYPVTHLLTNSSN